MTICLVALAAIAALLICYAIGIQSLRGGAWRVLVVFLWTGLPLDVLLNFTLFAVLMLDVPRSGEWTFSKRLPRLNRDTGWRGYIARPTSSFLNWLDPTGQHVAP